MRIFASRTRALVAVLVVLVLVAVVLKYAGTALVRTVPIDQPDAIVALGSHEWERLPVAAAFAVQFPSSRVILTEPPRITRFTCHDCPHRVDLLNSLGVARNRVTVLRLVDGTTYGEAIALRDLLHGTKARRLLVVTSAYHTRRAFATFSLVFAQEGVQIGIQPAAASVFAAPQRWWTRPYDRWYVTYEWSAAVWNQFRRGVPLFA